MCAVFAMGNPVESCDQRPAAKPDSAMPSDPRPATEPKDLARRTTGALRLRFAPHLIIKDRGSIKGAKTTFGLPARARNGWTNAAMKVIPINDQLNGHRYARPAYCSAAHSA